MSMIFALIAAMSGLGFTQAPAPPDPIKVLVDRLDLERYKAAIKGLTQFGDRREGTQRNRDAVDWIEAQLKSYGCTNTERIKYEARAGRGGGDAAVPAAGGATAVQGGAAGAAAAGQGGGRGQGQAGAAGQGAAAGGAAA